MQDKVLAIIPCLNEELTIQQTIKSIQNVSEKIKIVVVDNNSTDNTVKKAEELDIQVIRCFDQGKGKALKFAFSKIENNYDFIFICDGDLTYGMENLEKAISTMRNNNLDMILGVRKSDKLTEESDNKIYRFGHQSANKILSKIFSLLFNLKISDIFTGWRLMSLAFVKSFQGGQSAFEIEAELNTHAYVLNARIGEIPVSYRARANGSISKLNTYRDGFKIIRKQLKMYRYEKPLVAFSILASPWFVIGMWLNYVAVRGYIETGLVEKFPSLIAGSALLILSGLLWIAGVILERITQFRHEQVRSLFSSFQPKVIN